MPNNERRIEILSFAESWERDLSIFALNCEEFREFAEFCRIFLNFAQIISIQILIDLFLSFPQNFEFLFYDHY